MINVIKKYSTRSTILLAIVMATILPLISISLAYIFRNDIAVDKPKLVENPFKSVVSFVASFICLFISNVFTKVSAEKKINGLRNQIHFKAYSFKQCTL